MKHFLVATVICFSTASVGLAADLPLFPDGERTCGAPLTVLKSEIVNANQLGRAWSSPSDFSGEPFIVWEEQHEVTVTKLASRASDGKWKAVSVKEGGGVQASFGTKSGSAWIATMHTVEGPGQEFVTIATRDGAKSFACGVVSFPKSLNEPTWSLEFLSITGFQGFNGGQGTLLTKVENDEDKSSPFPYFLYSTANGGEGWSEAKGLKAQGMLPNGDYAPLRAGVAESLFKSMPTRF